MTAALAIAGTLACLAAAQTAQAGPVRGVTTPMRRPVVAPGGVMLLPLDAEEHGDAWPGAITVEFAQGGPVDGRVIWLHRVDSRADVHWTSPAARLAVRPIRDDDDSSAGFGRPLLLVDLPPDVGGDASVLGVDLSPVWREAPADPVGSIVRAVGDAEAPPAPDRPTLARELRPDRPDPDSPFEYWRWVLLASAMDMTPPDPPGDEIERLVARHYADLWRIGFARLASASPGVARTCRDLLTVTCRDGGTEFAAWVADASALQALLSTLLDFDRPADRIVDAALDWADARDLMFFFPLDDDLESVRFAFVNSDLEPRLVTFHWIVEGRRGQERLTPIAVELEPRRLTRVTIDRPESAPPPAEGLPAEGVRAPAPPVLHMESGTFDRRLRVRPAVIEAEPPGLRFGPFESMLTLANVRSLQRAAPPAAYATQATVRRIDGRWEVFFECFRPRNAPRPRKRGTGGTGAASDVTGAASAAATGRVALDELDALADVRGVEAATLLLGPVDGATTVLTVPETGPPRLWRGRGSDALEIHRRSLTDRWYCRVVVPDAWLDFPLEPLAAFGFMRTHAGSPAVETSPNPAVPWRLEPTRITIDLMHWDDLPG